MKITEVFILLLLFGVLGFGFYVLWLNLPWGPVKYEAYRANFIENLTDTSSQFYPNLRYPDRIITYSIDQNCNSKRVDDAQRAFSRISGETILDFEEANASGEIIVDCSNTPEPDKSYYIAGEGGPVDIINASSFNVILSGKVSLYRADKCDEPQIATHEILHALGFDHNNDSKSIMYFQTACDQQIDGHIINEINKLYSIPGLPDLAIEEVSATKVGRFLNFDIVISNIGLKNAKNSTLVIYADDSEVNEVPIEALEVGTKRIFNVQNMRVPRSFNAITFDVETKEEEISIANNEVTVNVE